jgi:hypothetical protein
MQMSKTCDAETVIIDGRLAIISTLTVDTRAGLEDWTASMLVSLPQTVDSHESQ